MGEEEAEVVTVELLSRVKEFDCSLVKLPDVVSVVVVNCRVISSVIVDVVSSVSGTLVPLVCDTVVLEYIPVVSELDCTGVTE